MCFSSVCPLVLLLTADVCGTFRQEGALRLPIHGLRRLFSLEKYAIISLNGKMDCPRLFIMRCVCSLACLCVKQEPVFFHTRSVKAVDFSRTRRHMFTDGCQLTKTQRLCLNLHHTYHMFRPFSRNQMHFF